jgi:hypothetical protein
MHFPIKISIVSALLTLHLIYPVTAQVPQSKSLRNGKTSKHIHVAGTKIFIIPPPGFTQIQYTTQLKKNDYNFIEIVENPESNFYLAKKTLTAESMKEKGFTCTEINETKLGPYHAKYGYFETSNAGHSQILIFGDTSFTVMIIAVFTLFDQPIKSELKKSLFSTIYDPKIVLDLHHSAAFTVDETQSEFIYKNSISQIFNFTKKGGSGLDSTNKYSIVQFKCSPSVTPEDVSKEFIDGLKGASLKVNKIINESYNDFNGDFAYEVVFDCTAGGNEYLVYHLAIIHKNIALLANALTTKESRSNLEAVKKFAYTIKFK